MLMTEADLDAIYRLLAMPGVTAGGYMDGAPAFCLNPHPDVDLFNEDLLEAGFVSYAALTDFNHRRLYEHSLWVRRADHKCVPELYALATIRYGTLRTTSRPYWTDRDWTNSCKENVTLPAEKGVFRRPESKYGVKSGSAEYTKRYYQDPVNRDKQRIASRRYAEKQRALVRGAKQVVGAPLDAKAAYIEQLRREILGPDARLGSDDDRAFGQSVPTEVSEPAPTLLDEVSQSPEELEALLNSHPVTVTEINLDDPRWDTVVPPEGVEGE